MPTKAVFAYCTHPARGVNRAPRSPQRCVEQPSQCHAGLKPDVREDTRRSSGCGGKGEGRPADDSIKPSLPCLRYLLYGGELRYLNDTGTAKYEQHILMCVTITTRTQTDLQLVPPPDHRASPCLASFDPPALGCVSQARPLSFLRHHHDSSIVPNEKKATNLPATNAKRQQPCA